MTREERLEKALRDLYDELEYDGSGKGLGGNLYPPYMLPPGARSQLRTTIRNALAWADEATTREDQLEATLRGLIDAYLDCVEMQGAASVVFLQNLEAGRLLLAPLIRRADDDRNALQDACRELRGRLGATLEALTVVEGQLLGKRA